LRPEALICRGVGIDGCWCGVVRETESVPIVASPFIQKALICSIPGTFGVEELLKLPELVLAG
jgi:hypothetical protein